MENKKEFHVLHLSEEIDWKLSLNKTQLKQQCTGRTTLRLPIWVTPRFYWTLASTSQITFQQYPQGYCVFSTQYCNIAIYKVETEMSLSRFYNLQLAEKLWMWNILNFHAWGKLLIFFFFWLTSYRKKINGVLHKSIV